MKKVTGVFCFILFVACINNVTAQTHVLTVDSFIKIIRSNHPAVKQATVITQQAAANLLASRGAFDPALSIEKNKKTFTGVDYYKYNNAELKIPTIAGIELKTGIERSTGLFPDPQLSKGVASYAGIELPLLKGLLLDKRRAALQQAKIMINRSEQEKATLLNDIFFDAYKTYWEWVASFKLYNIYGDYVAMAKKRMRLVKITYEQGDRSPADTTEAYTQIQNYELLQADALMKLNNSRFGLSQYLWAENTVPYLLPQNNIPDTLAFSNNFLLHPIDTMAENIALNHPEIKSYNFKLLELNIDRKLYFQNLLPAFNIQANILSKEYYQFKGLNNSYLTNNYKFGFTLKTPFLFREARGNYRGVKLKIQQTSFLLQEKIWAIQNKISAYYNEAKQVQLQINITNAMFDNYFYLLRIEELKFAQGESSLFIINSRENKLLETKQKQIELTLKYLKAVYGITWAGGQFR